MSALTDRRATWDAKEAVRAEFFRSNSLEDPNVEAIAGHQRERDILLLAESIAATGDWCAHTTNRPVDGAMIAEARALAVAE